MSNKSGADIGWLIARPIAHRGLHDAKKSIVENSLSAATAAIKRKFAIECDVQLTGDGKAIVFHDSTLDRLTRKTGKVTDHSAAALTKMSLRHGGDTIPSLKRFLETVVGKVPLIIEIKSDFSGNVQLAKTVAQTIKHYRGPVALKSFDPGVMAFLRKNQSRLGISQIPLGMVAEARYDHPGWSVLGAAKLTEMAEFLHWPDTRPDFLSYNVNHLPSAVPFLLRSTLHLPVMTWTVRTNAQRKLAKKWADQMIFEGDKLT